MICEIKGGGLRRLEMIPEHDDISAMTDDELMAYYKYHDSQQSLKDGSQMVRKILLKVGHFIQ